MPDRSQQGANGENQPPRPSRSRAEAIDDFIDRWHNAPPGELDGPLHEEMGWTWDEYAAWAMNPSALPPEREGAL